MMSETSLPVGPRELRRRYLKAALIIGAIFGTPLLIVHLLMGPLFYYSDPITGTVIDEATGKPLAGVLVAAGWVTDGNEFIRPSKLYGECTITDNQGHFRLRGLPPRLRPPFDELDGWDPYAVFYKPGYRVDERDSRGVFPTGINPKAMNRRCVWNHDTIALPRVRTNAEEIAALDGMRDFRQYYLTNHARGLEHFLESLKAGAERLPSETSSSE